MCFKITLGFLSVLGCSVLSNRSKWLGPNVHVGGDTEQEFFFTTSVYVYMT
jgi:hypothetical protein